MGAVPINGALELFSLQGDHDSRPISKALMAEPVPQLKSSGKWIDVLERERQLSTAAANTLLSVRFDSAASTLGGRQMDGHTLQATAKCHKANLHAGHESVNTPDRALMDRLQQLEQQVYLLSQLCNHRSATFADPRGIQERCAVENRSDCMSREEGQSLENRLQEMLDRRFAVQNERLDQLQVTVSEQRRSQGPAPDERQDSVIANSKQDEGVERVTAIESQLAEGQRQTSNTIETLQDDLAKAKATAEADTARIQASLAILPILDTIEVLQNDLSQFKATTTTKTKRLGQIIAALPSVKTLEKAANAHMQRHMVIQAAIWNQQARDLEHGFQTQLATQKQESDEQIAEMRQYIDRRFAQTDSYCHSQLAKLEDKFTSRFDRQSEWMEKQVRDVSKTLSKPGNGTAQPGPVRGGNEHPHSCQLTREIRALQKQIGSLLTHLNQLVEEPKVTLAEIRHQICTLATERDASRATVLQDLRAQYALDINSCRTEFQEDLVAHKSDQLSRWNSHVASADEIFESLKRSVRNHIDGSCTHLRKTVDAQIRPLSEFDPNRISMAEKNIQDITTCQSGLKERVLEIRDDFRQVERDVENMGAFQSELKTKLIVSREDSRQATSELLDRIDTFDSRFDEREKASLKADDRLQSIEEELRDQLLSSKAAGERMDHVEMQSASSIQALLDAHLIGRKDMEDSVSRLMKSQQAQSFHVNMQIAALQRSLDDFAGGAGEACNRILEHLQSHDAKFAYTERHAKSLAVLGSRFAKSVRAVDTKADGTARRVAKQEDVLHLYASKFASVERQVKASAKLGKVILGTMAKMNGKLDQTARDAVDREDLLANAMSNLQRDCADARDAFQDALASSEARVTWSDYHTVARLPGQGEDRLSSAESTGSVGGKRKAAVVNDMHENAMMEQEEVRRKRKRKRKSAAARAAEDEYGGWR